MKPITPAQLHEGASLVTFAVTQPELYYALPASVGNDGTVMTEWELSAEDLSMLLNGGRLRLWVMFTDVHKGKPLTPVCIEAIEAVA